MKYLTHLLLAVVVTILLVGGATLLIEKHAAKGSKDTVNVPPDQRGGVIIEVKKAIDENRFDDALELLKPYLGKNDQTMEWQATRAMAMKAAIDPQSRPKPAPQKSSISSSDYKKGERDGRLVGAYDARTWNKRGADWAYLNGHRLGNESYAQGYRDGYIKGYSGR